MELERRSGGHREGLREEAGDRDLPFLKPCYLIQKKKLNNCASPHHKLSATITTDTEPGLILDRETIFTMNTGQTTVPINTGLALNETLSYLST